MLLAISSELALFYGSILAIVGLWVGRTGFRFGLPTLLLFLGVGMLANGMGIVNFNDPHLAQTIGMVALIVILFSGGMDTSLQEIRPVAGPGVVLATVGVLLTAVITGTFIYYFTQWMPGPVQLSYLESLLLASVMSSTDSASVFSILRSKKMHLKHNLKPLLEFESGSNDPMAYMLTIILIQLIQAEGSIGPWEALGMFALQLVLGVGMGYLLGRLSVWVVNKFELQATALYPVLVLALSFFIFSFTTLIYGNGYMAVYIGGLMIGNSKMVHRVSVQRFFDGFQWMCQLVMFLALGMLVNLSSLVEFAVPALIIAIFMMLFGRPISVLLSLIPFWNRFNARAKTYISWVGLRGAVPIIFATYPLVSGIESADVMFAVVFFVTLVSLLIQGSSVSVVAEKLHLVDEDYKEPVFKEIKLPEHIKSTLSEIIVTEGMIDESNMLKDLRIPEGSLAILLQRGSKHCIPRGNTELEVGDHVLLISNDVDSLVEAYEELGVDNYILENNA